MELRPHDTAGDGAAGSPPQPGSDVGALLAELLAEQRKQTALLHRIVLGDVDQLDAADVKAALKCGDRKLDELVEDGELPMYQLADRGPRRISRDTLRAVIRRWAERR